MAKQLNLFPHLNMRGNAEVRGDVATSTTNVLWTIEECVNRQWYPMARMSFQTREEARQEARAFRRDGCNVRVTPYKKAYDSKMRDNRQVIGERRDY